MILLRFGLLAAFVTQMVVTLWTRMPITLDPTAWYFESSMAVLLVMLALSVYGFVVGLGNRLSLEPAR